MDATLRKDAGQGRGAGQSSRSRAARFLLAMQVGLLGMLPALPERTQADGIDIAGFGSFDGGMAGTTSLAWLRLPVGARNVAVGGRSLTTDEDATAQLSNPAMVAMAEHTDYAMSHAEVMGEFRLEHLCLAMPWKFGGNLGVTLGALITGTFENARDIDEEASQPTASDLLVGATFGRHFLEGRLSLGARVQILRSAIDDVSGYAGDLSLGALWRIGTDWRVAGALQHWGPGVLYSTEAPLQSQPLAWNLEIGKPMVLENWSAQLGLHHEATGVLKYYAGGEWFWKDLMLFRLGYEGSLQDRELGLVSGLSAGFGVRWEALTVDYGFKHMGYLGSYQSFGLSYSKRMKDRRNDEFLLKEAKATYAEGRYKRALALTRKALAYNPKNYKAQALQGIILADLERMDDRAVSILYTANTRGSLAPMWIAGKPLGGLARRAAKLKELRESYPHNVLIDAGDLLTGTAKEETRGFLAAAYSHMHYDAVGVGPWEWARGDTLLGKDLPFIATQKPWSDFGGGVAETRSKKLPYGGRIRMFSVTLDGVSTQSGLETASSALERHLGKLDSVDLVVVTVRGTLQHGYLLANKFPRIDVIIMAGEKGVLQVPMKAGNTFIVCPGVDGVYLGQLTFVIDKNGKRLSQNHRLIPLDAKVPEDETVDRLLSSAIVDLNQTLLGDGELEQTAKVLPFIDDSAEVKGRLHLLDLVTGSTFHCPLPGMQVQEPAVAWGRNLIAFVSPSEKGTELYAFTPGRPEIDTLTRAGGVISQPVFGLRGKAVFALYRNGDQSDLVRIDPWRHEMINLTQGRLGQVHSFALSPQQDKLIFAARLGGTDIITLAGADLSSPAELARFPHVIGRMIWSPDGDRFAFLKGNSPEDTVGEIQLYDTRQRGLINLTGGSSVHEMTFASGSRHLYFAAGESVADLNVAQLDSLTLSKLTEGGEMPRHEREPLIRYYDDQEWIVFKVTDGVGTRLVLLDPVTRKEKVILPSRPGLRLR